VAAATAGPADPAARTMRLTIYDDGRSCPADCDAHVVFDPAINGTANAHRPDSASGSYQRCQSGQPCRICFDASPRSCIVAMYRGAGPHADAFDFTPAFYEAWCPRPDLPARLTAQCAALAAAARQLDGKLNCVRTPDDQRCRALIDAARQRQAADQPLYDECRRVGEAAFNQRRPPAEQRSNGCAYEKVGTGQNSQGRTWRKLLAGACRDGTYVGRDGLDCCSGNPFSDGPLGVECRAFYLAP
ncbi:MAG: hypothetical protein ACRERC_19575, partial [Candidatus Binatia bacterium]